MEKQLARKLCVIFYADVEGYSRLTDIDEEGTFHRLKASFELISSQIELHRGHVLQFAGDAVLAKFDAISNALACAIEIQKTLDKDNHSLERANKLQFRIGINVSDVIEDKGRFHGSGINIAARLESLAIPGGICISEAVRALAGDTLPLDFEDIGEQSVKNIADPVRAFYVTQQAGHQMPDLTVQATNKAALSSITKFAMLVGALLLVALLWFFPWGLDDEDEVIAQLSLPNKPSIAVLAFNNMSSDTEQDYFADGLVENIITDLSHYQDIFVIARHSSFHYKGESPDIREVGRQLGVRYILEGSIQKSDERIRVTVQLIDAITAGHLWSKRYDRPLGDVFELQDEITDHIVSVIAPVGAGSGKLQKTELKRLAQTPTKNLQAFDYFLRGIIHFDKFTKHDNTIARQLFEKAIEIDPGYARAIAKIAITHLQDYWNGWVETPESSLKMVDQLARQALSRDPNNSWGHFSMGNALLFQRKHEAALKEYELSISLSPGEADLYIEYGLALIYAGRAAEAFPNIKDAMRLNPFYPGWYLWNLSWAHFFNGEYEQASAALEKRNPKSNFTYLLLAASYTQQNRKQEADKAMKTFLKLEPNYSLKIPALTEPFKRPQDLELWLSTLRQAGLPE